MLKPAPRPACRRRCAQHAGLIVYQGRQHVPHEILLSRPEQGPTLDKPAPKAQARGFCPPRFALGAGLGLILARLLAFLQTAPLPQRRKQLVRDAQLGRRPGRR